MEKPFVFLFSSPNAHYCYDVNTNSLLSISADLYKILTAWEDGSDVQHRLETCDEYVQLTAQGYLSGDHPKITNHPLSSSLGLYQTRKMGQLILQVTQNCNFRCRYCTYTSGAEGLQRSHSSKRMPWDVAKRSVDYFAEHSYDYPTPYVSFYGGEPLLEFDLMQNVVEYSKIRMAGRNISFSVTVNGSLLDDKKLAFLQENNFNLLISLDGLQQDNDKNRVFASSGKGTFSTVIERMRHLVKEYPELAKHTSVNMVVDRTAPHILFDPKEIDKEVFQHINVRQTYVDNTYLDVDKISSDQVLESRYTLQTALAILAAYGCFPSDKVALVAKENLNQIVLSLSRHFRPRKATKTWCPSGPCTPGVTRLFVTCNGDFYPCERVSEVHDDLKIGNIYSGFDLAKSQKLLNLSQMSPEECSKCAAQNCCIVCARSCVDTNGLTKAQKAQACENTRSRFAHEIKLLALMLEGSRVYGKETPL